MHQTYWTFVILCALLTVTPGADTALVLKSAMTAKRNLFLATIIGICTGLLFHAFMSSLGLSAILKTSAQLYSVVKLAGAGYLIYLGLRALYEAWSKNLKVETGAEKGQPGASGRASTLSEFRVGLLTNILNPKVAIFYLTFLPQFIDPSRNVLLQSVLLSLVHIFMSLIWLTMIGYFVSYFKSQLEKPSLRRTVESVTGFALLVFGLRLATSQD